MWKDWIRPFVRPLPQWSPVAVAPPQTLVTATLRGNGESADVTADHTVASLRPLAIATSVDAGASPELEYRDNATGKLLGILRLARTPKTPDEEKAIADAETVNLPDPVYGHQLQDLAVPGLAAEGRMKISYTEKPVTLAGGEVVSLRAPSYSVTDLAYGPLDPATTISPRVAPAMIGLGLIEAIPAADMLAHADPDDRDGDGISGKAAIVRDHLTGQIALGRFGWKAQNATNTADSRCESESRCNITVHPPQVCSLGPIR